MSFTLKWYAGLHGVLDSADEFAQFRTLWKVAILAGYELGCVIDIAMPENHRYQHVAFLERYVEAKNIVDIESWNIGQPISYGFFQAGEAMISREGAIHMLEHEEVRCLSC